MAQTAAASSSVRVAAGQLSSRETAVGGPGQRRALLGGVVVLMVVLLADPLALGLLGILGKSAALATIVLTGYVAFLGARKGAQKPSERSRAPSIDLSSVSKQDSLVRGRFVTLSTAAANTRQLPRETASVSASSSAQAGGVVGGSSSSSPSSSSSSCSAVSAASGASSSGVVCRSRRGSTALFLDTHTDSCSQMSPARSTRIAAPDPLSPAMQKLLKRHRLSLDLSAGALGQSPVKLTPMGHGRPAAAAAAGAAAALKQDPDVRRAVLVPRGQDPNQRIQRVWKHPEGQFQSVSVTLPSRGAPRPGGDAQNDPVPEGGVGAGIGRARRGRSTRGSMTPMATSSSGVDGSVAFHPPSTPSALALDPDRPPSQRDGLIRGRSAAAERAAQALRASGPALAAQAAYEDDLLNEFIPPPTFMVSVVSAPVPRRVIFARGGGGAGNPVAGNPVAGGGPWDPQHKYHGTALGSMPSPSRPGSGRSGSSVVGGTPTGLLASPASSRAESQMSDSEFGDGDGPSPLPVIDEEDHVSDVDIVQALGRAPRVPTDALLFRVAFVLKQEILGNVSRRRRKRQRKRRGALASTHKQRELWDIFETPADMAGADAGDTNSLHETVFCVGAKLFQSAKLSVDTLLASLVFLRRLTERAGLVLTEENWAGVFFTAVVLGQKWVDDVSYPTASVMGHCPIFTMDQLRPMERAAIELAEWHLAVEDVHTIAVIRHFGLYAYL